jgi:hypothetical protein
VRQNGKANTIPDGRIHVGSRVGTIKRAGWNTARRQIMAVINRCVICFQIMNATGDPTGTDKANLKKGDHITLDQCNSCRRKAGFNERDIYYEGKSLKEAVNGI